MGCDCFHDGEALLREGGEQGRQLAILTGGSYYNINPDLFEVITESSPSNYDAALRPILVNVMGHRLQVDISQTLEIPEPAAPTLVSRFGGAHTSRLGGLVDDPLPVQRFVERVLGGMVETYFNAIASASTVEEFLSMYASTRTDLSSQVRNALAAWGIEARGATLGEFESSDPELDRARRRLADKQMETRELEAEENNSVIRERIRDRERRGERKDRMLETVVLERKIELLGGDTIAKEMFLHRLKGMGVPEVVSGNADELLRHLPLQRALALIESAQRHARMAALPKGAEGAKSIEAGEDAGGALDAVDIEEDEDGSAVL
ncbi:hypothetical protein [Streptomyces sp. NPDC004134]|uniref:hypothetical protein n=1 Tax=Streptomyces sp. NPDC004134 TaxID=3364691 RepID=UPI0036AAD7CF